MDTWIILRYIIGTSLGITLTFSIFKYVILPIIIKQTELASSHLYSKLQEDHRSRNLQDIELLRSQLSVDQQLVGILANGYTSTQSLRMEAINTLWIEALKVRSTCDKLVWAYSILTIDELESDGLLASGNGSLGEMILMEAKSSQTKLNELLTTDIESIRPLIGERLWLLFYVHRGYLGGLYSSAAASVLEKGKYPSLAEYHKSRRDLITSVIAKKDYDEAISKQIAAPQIIREQIESEILKEMNNWIFGSNVIQLSVDQRKALIDDMIHERKK